MDFGMENPVEFFQQRVVLRGTVEGVGMRPALFRFARKLELTGWVRNRSCEVELVWQGSAEALEQARGELPAALPPESRIDSVEYGPVEPLAAKERDREFVIRDSGDSASGGKVNLLTPPDLAPCPECRAEWNDPADRRFHHAFNSCGNCGPRATVIEALPYDREATAWRDFPLCPECRREYENSADRRFHIEGISCPHCGPRLELLGPGGLRLAEGDAALQQAGRALADGKILALKGVGGFQLLADPRRKEALQTLRLRKHRPDKPLALMAADAACAARFFELAPEAAAALASSAAPIVLAPWKEDGGRGFHPELIAPDRPEEAGVMLPASPLHALLMREFGGPLLVATSGNASGEPPALDTAEALRELDKIADVFLSHNRTILWRHDDSLAALNAGQLQLWRRARGFGWAAGHGDSGIRRPVLALGGGQKNAFAAAGRDWLLLSPHHGELDEAGTAAEWEDALRRTVDQLAEKPECVAVDLHPDYYSSILGRKLAEKWGLPLVRVQHHHAHVLAGMYEYSLPAALALVFDGTGLGADGTLWGAELFWADRERGIRRLASFVPAPLPGGEAAIRDCRRQWLARRWAAGLPHDGTPFAELLYTQCECGINTPLTSSAGRLFDACSAAFGFAPERVTYEGQAAIRLEAAAWRESGGDLRPFPWSSRLDGELLRIDWTPLWLDDPARHATPARDFHHALAEAALAMLDHAAGVAGSGAAELPVLLTGGVMQNRYLTSLLMEKLGSRCLLPRQIPPNDGGIAVGQVFQDGWRLD